MLNKPFIKTGNAFTAICDRITDGYLKLTTSTGSIHALMVLIVIVVVYYNGYLVVKMSTLTGLGTNIDSYSILSSRGCYFYTLN